MMRVNESFSESSSFAVITVPLEAVPSVTYAVLFPMLLEEDKTKLSFG